MPLTLVTAVADVAPLKRALEPLPGTVNVTVTPLTGFEDALRTIACSGVANTALIVALCGVPEFAAIEAGDGDVFVRLKPADVVTPITLAATV